MEVQSPVSPQQSECNPVGALQVCPAIGHLCLSPLKAGLWGKVVRGKTLFWGLSRVLPLIWSPGSLGQRVRLQVVLSLSLVPPCFSL